LTDKDPNRVWRSQKTPDGFAARKVHPKLRMMRNCGEEVSRLRAERAPALRAQRFDRKTACLREPEADSGSAGFVREEVDTVLEAIALNAVVATPGPSPYPSPDAGDQHLFDLLDCLGDAVLVTRDEALDGPDRQFAILAPRDFVDAREP